jgi:hypothetical protein
MKLYHRAPRKGHMSRRLRLNILPWIGLLCGSTLTYAQTSPTLPNPKLTPGSVRTTDAKEICSHGTRELRLYNNDKERARERYVHVLRSYGVNAISAKTNKSQLDHLVPLGIGGADDESNLWPQPYDEAILKDKLEWRMRDLVCKENVPSEKLQQEIRTNWWDAYKKYVTQ